MKNQARYQIMKMIFSLKGNYLLYQLSFNGFPAEIIRRRIGLLWSSQYLAKVSDGKFGPVANRDRYTEKSTSGGSAFLIWMF